MISLLALETLLGPCNPAWLLWNKLSSKLKIELSSSTAWCHTPLLCRTGPALLSCLPRETPMPECRCSFQILYFSRFRSLLHIQPSMTKCMQFHFLHKPGPTLWSNTHSDCCILRISLFPSRRGARCLHRKSLNQPQMNFCRSWNMQRSR